MGNNLFLLLHIESTPLACYKNVLNCSRKSILNIINFCNVWADGFTKIKSDSYNITFLCLYNDKWFLKKRFKLELKTMFCYFASYYYQMNIILKYFWLSIFLFYGSYHINQSNKFFFKNMRYVHQMFRCIFQFLKKFAMLRHQIKYSCSLLVSYIESFSAESEDSGPERKFYNAIWKCEIDQ